MIGRASLAALPMDGHPCADWRVRSGWRLQESLLDGTWLVRRADGRVAARGDRRAAEEAFAAAPPLRRGRAVVVLHGLGRPRSSMRAPAAALSAAGFEVVAVGYPSLLRSFDACVRQVAAVVDGLLADGAAEIGFVGHSLGGLVARAVISGGSARVGGLVTIGTPHNGAVVADRAAALLPRRLVDKGCLPAIVGGAAGVPLPDVPTAVVAGGNGKGGYNPLLDGDNDGIVTVAETRPANESLFLLVPSVHTVLMDHPLTLGAALSFLGARFKAGDAP
jgi:pimeloyl-ACP methyl ester carboxylesterase